MRGSQRLRSLALLGLSLVICPQPAKAFNIFDAAWGVMRDPFGLMGAAETVSNSVTNTLFQVSQLENTTYTHVGETIEHIRSVMREGLAGISTIEAQVNRDAIALVVRVNCLTGDALNDQLQQAIVQAMDTISQSNPSFEILGHRVSWFKVNKVVIPNPNEAYNIAKQAMYGHLAKTITETTNADVILAAYQNLERVAKATRCRYLDQQYERRYMDEVADLEIRSMPWTMLLKVSP